MDIERDTPLQSANDGVEGISTTRDSDSPIEPQDSDAQSASGGDDTASLAYSYWQERGCPDGCPEDDWFRAEQDLSSRQATK